MPSIPTADDLRTLNLAYRHLQRDFRILMPELFRRSESITTDASGYLMLPTYVLEVEDIRDGNNLKLPKIDIEEKFSGTGYYPEGVDIAGGSAHGKRRLMVRVAGAAKALTAYTVTYTREYDDLASTSAVPVPFSGKIYLDMLTTLQAWYWLSEQGEERKKEKADRWADYKVQLEMAGHEGLDDEPEYLSSSHSDAGAANRYPILTQ